MPHRSEPVRLHDYEYGRRNPGRIHVVRHWIKGWAIYRGTEQLKTCRTFPRAIKKAQRIARHIEAERIRAVEGQP